MTVGASHGAEQSVQDSINVRHDVEGESKVLSVCSETFRGGEGDDGDPGVTELVEVIAHGDHVFLAGQSSEVPVQDQHQWPPSHLGRPPRLTLVIDELEVGENVTDLEAHLGAPVWMPLRNDRQRVDFLEQVGVDAFLRMRREVGSTALTWPAVTVPRSRRRSRRTAGMPRLRGGSRC